MKRTKEELLEFYGLKPGDVILTLKNGIKAWYKVTEFVTLIPLNEKLEKLDGTFGKSYDLSIITSLNWEYYRKEDLEKLGQKRCDATLCATCPLNMLNHTYESRKQEQPTLYEVLEEVFKGSPKTEENKEVYSLLKSKLDRYI